MKLKQVLQLFIGLAISAVALWYVFKDITLKELLDSFRSFNYLYLIPSLAVFYFGLVLRIVRWQWLFRPKYKIPLSHASAGIFICFAFNSVFPARLGEFARAYLVGKKDNTGFGTAMGTVVAERLLDALTLLPCLILALKIAPISPDTQLAVNVFGKDYVLTGAKFAVVQTEVIRLCLILLAGIVAVALPVTRGWILAVMHKTPGLPHGLRTKIESLIHQFAEGVNFFRSPMRLIGLFLFSFLIWCTNVSAVMFLAWGYPDMAMSFVQAFALTVMVCIFIMVPAAPGYWGFFEAGVIFSVVIMGIHPNDALVRSYAILLHLTQWVPIVAIGLPWAWFSHVSLGKLEEAKEVEQQ